MEEAAIDASDARSRHDAAGEGGYCAHIVPEAGTWFVCDDFDEVADAGALGVNGGYGTGRVLGTTTDASESPPRSMFVAANPTTSMGNESGSYIARVLPLSNQYAVSFDVKVSVLQQELQQAIAAITFPSGASIVIYLTPAANGQLSQVSVQEVDDSGSGPTYQPFRSYAVTPSANGWNHFSLTLTGGPSSPVDSFAVNGDSFEALFPIGAGFFVENATVVVGWYFASAPGLRAAFMDNVVMTAQ